MILIFGAVFIGRYIQPAKDIRKDHYAGLQVLLHGTVMCIVFAHYFFRTAFKLQAHTVFTYKAACSS